MDGSIHLWFDQRKTCLHLAIDKTTNTVLGGFFVNQETLNGYYNLFNQILHNYGIPAKFRTDNRTIFNYHNERMENRTSEKDVLTKFGYACKQLGVDLETTSISQAKGLIERTNATFQGRLVNEFKLNKIDNIYDANKYLTEKFIPSFNKRFSLDYKKFDSVFSAKPDDIKINYILAILTPRKIDNGNTIKFHNVYYQPYKDDKLICFRPKTECLVIKSFNGDLLVTVDDGIYELRKVEKHLKTSEEFDFEEVKVKEPRKKYIPPMTHPWRLQSYKDQIYRSHYERKYA